MFAFARLDSANPMIIGQQIHERTVFFIVSTSAKSHFSWLRAAGAFQRSFHCFAGSRSLEISKLLHGSDF